MSDKETAVVYAVDTVNIMMPEGNMVLIQRGQPHSSDSPVVRFKPELFSDNAELWSRPAPTSIGADGQPLVEQMTANPGERRNARRG